MLAEKGGWFLGERWHLSGRKVAGFSLRGLSFPRPVRLVTLDNVIRTFTLTPAAFHQGGNKMM